MEKKSRTSIGLAIVRIFFSVHLFCFVSLPNSLSVLYRCVLIILSQRGDSSEDHCIYFDFTVALFCIFFSSYDIVLVFNTRHRLSIGDVKTA